MGNTLRVSHILLKVKDLEKAEAFYTRVMGMEVVTRETRANGQPLVVMGQGVGLTPSEDPQTTKSHDHIGIRIENADVLIAALQKAGVPIADGPKKGQYGTSVYFLDPDGNRLECHDADRR
jgi:lactoylglutathione lyase